MQRIIFCFLFMLSLAWDLGAQTPACTLSADFSYMGVIGKFYDNRTTQCTTWQVSYYAQGFSSLSIHFQWADDKNGTPDTWNDFADDEIQVGTNPMTDTKKGSARFYGFHPWVQIIASPAVGSGKATAKAYGYVNNVSAKSIPYIAGTTVADALVSTSAIWTDSGTVLTPKAGKSVANVSGIVSRDTDPPNCNAGDIYRNTTTDKTRRCSGSGAWVDVIESDANGNIAIRATVTPRTVSGSDQSIVLVPDIQCYAENQADAACSGTPQLTTGQSMFTWISDNKVANNTGAVLLTGDLVNSNRGPDWYTTQWTNYGTERSILDASTIPYITAAGNHDYDGGYFSDARNLTYYTANAGSGHVNGQSWYGGAYTTSPAANYWIKWTSADGKKYGAITVEFCATPGMMDWASSVIDANTDRRWFFLTHYFLNADGTIGNNTTTNACSGDNGADPAENGTAWLAPSQMWAGWLSQRDTYIYAILSGHVEGPARADLVGSHGYVIPAVTENYQFTGTGTNGGGEGRASIITIQSASASLDVKTYATATSLWPIDYPAGVFTSSYAGTGFSGVIADSDTGSVVVERNGPSTLYLHNNTAANDGTTFANIDFWGSTSPRAVDFPTSRINLRRTDSGSVGAISFLTRDIVGGNTVLTERLGISKTGAVITGAVSSTGNGAIGGNATVTGTLGVGGIATFNRDISLVNGIDSAQGISIQPGTSAEQIASYSFRNKAGTLLWQLQKNTSGWFMTYDAVNSIGRIKLVPNSDSFFNAGAGTYAVKVNSDAGSGTAGLYVYSGGASPTLAGYIDGTGHGRFISLTGTGTQTVSADSTGKLVRNTDGLTATKTVKGSDGNNCNLVFTDGRLTSTTCP